jgi:hypothetical protein
MQKGIEFKHSSESNEMILDIDNKYYQSEIKMNLINLNQKEDNQINSQDYFVDVEGLIVFWSSKNLGNIQVN